MRSFLSIPLFLLLFFPALAGGDGKKSCCSVASMPKAPAEKVAGETPDMKIPDIQVVDENGRQHRLFSDLMKDQVVAVSFIFTTCKTICPPIGANFAKLEKALGERAGKDVRLYSISVDPLTDTPARLKAWKAQFGGGKGWTLLTGAKLDIDRALKAMQFFTADKTQHSPFLLLGNQSQGVWRRVNGFTEPAKLVGLIDEIAGHAKHTKAEAENPARRYFGDIPLLDQSGTERRLYTDLMADKVIVMQSFFTSCTTVCPKTVGTFARIQEHLGERLGRDVHLLSISVDPANDTPERLKAYAAEWQAKPGWYFLTAEDPAVLGDALHKFGQKVGERDNHSNVFVIGNLRTGLWKKAFGLAGDKPVIDVLDSVLQDADVPAVSAASHASH